MKLRRNTTLLESRDLVMIRIRLTLDSGNLGRDDGIEIFSFFFNPNENHFFNEMLDQGLKRSHPLPAIGYNLIRGYNDIFFFLSFLRP